MKTLMFSLTIAVALVLYGAGLFVPETQGIEHTDDGLVILNDAAMSQLVGGPLVFDKRETHFLSTRANNKTPPNCNVPDWACDKTQVNIVYNRWTCVPCNTSQARRFKDTTNKKIIRERRTCVLLSDGCRPRHYVDYKQYSCEVDLNKWCRP